MSPEKTAQQPQTQNQAAVLIPAQVLAPPAPTIPPLILTQIAIANPVMFRKTMREMFDGSNVTEEEMNRCKVVRMPDALDTVLRLTAGSGADSRLRSNPPVFVEVPPSVLEKTTGNTAGMAYGVGSNIILVGSANKEKAAQKYPGMDMEGITAVHEVLHYAGYLSHGANISAGGQVSGKVGWLEEGMTEYATYRETYSKFNRTSDTLMYETATVAALSQLCGGPGVMMAAHLSGNMDPLRNALDSKLGAGTFKSLIGCHNGAEAFFLLMEKDPEGKAIDRQALLADPALRPLDSMIGFMAQTRN